MCTSRSVIATESSRYHPEVGDPALAEGYEFVPAVLELSAPDGRIGVYSGAGVTPEQMTAVGEVAAVALSLN